MKVLPVVALAWAACCPLLPADDVPLLADPALLTVPAPGHQWLEQLVGEWDAEIEMEIAPNQPAAKYAATETVKPLGGFWVISESQSDIDGVTFQGRMTLGYDPEKKKYSGTWVDSMTSILWVYEGTVDESGRVLTLESEGPCLHQGGRRAKFREVIEVLGPDEKKFTASVQNADGRWEQMMVIHYQRKAGE